jgi:FkbH-like protein
MKEFSQLKKNLKKDFSKLKKIRLAILGDSSTQLLVQAIRGIGFDRGFDFIIWEADFSQIERQIFDHSSELYKFKPEIVILFQSAHKLLCKYNKLEPEQYSQLASFELASIKNLTSILTDNLKAKLICYNYTEINDAIWGNFANKTDSSFLFQLRKLNYELMNFASKNPDLYLCDISTIQNRVGKANFFQPSIYINTEILLSIDVLPIVASQTVDLICALDGNFKKCIILDLDNTMWGGVIGDDGIENIQLGSLGIGKAFTEFQYWIKKLKNRGIILAVCSKNDELVAKEPFEKHPDMVLHLEDVSVFIANWENKADNIRMIQSILNIGFESMVFLDDNPFERNLVRENITEICIPELPEDPADYLEYLYSLNLFETVSSSEEDSERTKQYQTEAKRSTIRLNFTNEDDFLKSLNMTSSVEKFNKFSIPRVAQLTQRSNQFNLRTVRYTESDLEIISKTEGFFTFAFTLEDKYGNHGLISVVILKQESPQVLFIDTWLMSCRVLKRGMENFVINTLVTFAKENGYANLKGEYLVTPKNEMVRNHYLNLGFKPVDNYWYLNTLRFEFIITHINLKQ